MSWARYQGDVPAYSSEKELGEKNSSLLHSAWVLSSTAGAPSSSLLPLSQLPAVERE